MLHGQQHEEVLRLVMDVVELVVISGFVGSEINNLYLGLIKVVTSSKTSSKQQSAMQLPIPVYITQKQCLISNLANLELSSAATCHQDMLELTRRLLVMKLERTERFQLGPP